MFFSTSMSTAFLLPWLLLAAAAAAGESLIIAPGCQASCGGIDISYPFGIGNGCFHKGFQIDCNNNDHAGFQPFLAGTSIRVGNLSINPPLAQVMLPIRWRCYNTSNQSDSDRSDAITLNGDSIYRISNTENMLVVLGCSTMAIMVGRSDQIVLAGCASYCNSSESVQDDNCNGVGCCHVNIVPELIRSFFRFYEFDHSNVLNFNPCDYAFLVGKNNYTFQRSDLLRMDKNRTMPVWLDWAIRDNGSMSMSCADANKTTEYTCKSKNSMCVDSTNGPGYTCKCSDSYEGNAYKPEGCTDINECAFPDVYHCHGKCTNTKGSYDCRCGPGYESSDPKTQPCTQQQKPFPLASKLAIGVTLGISFLVTALLLAILIIQRRRMKIYFKKNGGLILRNVDTLEIFTKEEINKITKNHSVVLGKGCFGKVYKGILADGTTVAVKTAIKINKARKEEFTKEVEIQSQMIHKNIIKLLGCCLEVDVPMLVYEFAANGSLQDLLHGKNSLPFPLGLRLDIAIDAAEGLSYMHSSTTHPIRHGDVKPANILLDDNNMPKISDFGTSKFLTRDKVRTVLVVGSMEYIDPMFCATGKLTQKSDVYNFGVVLLELITRKPIVYDGNRRLIIEFPNVYEQDNSGRAMFDKDIVTEEDIFILEEIGKLALMCLQKEVEQRPDMKEVAERLVMLRRARKTGKRNYPNSYDLLDEISFEGTPKSFAYECS